METGTYLHLQRLSTEDGPGIRTTVFLKGCPATTPTSPALARSCRTKSSPAKATRS